MLLLTAVSFLTHQNIVGFGANNDEVQWVDLWTTFSGVDEPDPPPGVTWPSETTVVESRQVDNEDFTLRAASNDLLIVRLNDGTEWFVRRPGLQALISAVACRHGQSSIFYLDSRQEIVGVEGFA